MNWWIILVTFIGVNLDFFFILLFLLKKYTLQQVILGYIIGTVLLISLSFFAGQVLALFLPEWLLGVLGILPIYMAFKDDDDEPKEDTKRSPVMATCMTYLAVCAGCNLSIFLPVLTGLGFMNFLMVLLFLIILSTIIVLIINLIGNSKVVQDVMNKYGESLTKLVYIGVGLYVFWDSGLISHINCDADWFLAA